ncbi:ABC transporter ATP-binding protein [Hymenobacter sediminicola]|uniref:ATP-binding cassette domain-containing protein n=1 Tax=Hymenobacter sediminicola TaxID=2761579 RepID=A0A7G7W2H6_9BACT|nr:ATP-binding cassette domain-containing protein [Hymenobacter sediminicola]QNH60569.1 ATP-binding cassette domain-containing protein [Hymenobacter sediminicola]
MVPPVTPAIRAQHLSKHYDGHAVVQDVSFELAPGETLVLLGPSGCGKTTLLRMLNRLVEPDSGTVEVFGQDVRHSRPEQLRRGIGYVIQQVGLLPHYTVAENVGVVPRLLGHEPAVIATRTEELLSRLHLPPARYANQYPHQLSGGQQQRVGLARALVADPPLILLDEPFGALDPITRTSIRREFRELEELRRKTMVLVTHDVQEAFELADRILLLDAGQVQQLGTPHELLFSPVNDFVRRFFAAEQLALQLRTLRLTDLLPYLVPGSTNSSLSNRNIIPTTVTIQEAIEALSNASELTIPAEEQVIFVRSADTVSPISLTISSLMGAFGQAIQHLRRS